MQHLSIQFQNESVAWPSHTGVDRITLTGNEVSDIKKPPFHGGFFYNVS